MRGTPRWDDPDADLTIRKPGRKPKPKEAKRKCKCGCGEWSGYSTRHPWKALDYIHGHHSDKGGVERMRIENEGAREAAEIEAREEIAAFHAELDALFAEGRELGLTGNGLIAHVFTNDMEERSVRRVLERAVLEGNRDAINWAFSRKHGNASTKPAATPTAAPSFLEPLASEDEVFE